MSNTLAINSKIDCFGMLMSCVCAFHCLAMPIVFGLLPMLGASFLADEMTENLLLLLAFVIGLSSLIPGYFIHHRRILPIALFAVGLLVMVAGRFGVDEESPFEVVFSGIGAMLFAVSHFINYRFCKACCEVNE